MTAGTAGRTTAAGMVDAMDAAEGAGTSREAGGVGTSREAGVIGASREARGAALVELTDATIGEVVRLAGRPVLVDFGAPWCPPCRAMEPAVRALGAEYAERAVVARIDTDRNPETAARYGVLGLPTFVLFREGTEVARVTGMRPAAALRGLLDGALDVR